MKVALDKYAVVVNDNDNVNDLQAPPAQDARFNLHSERLGPLPLVNAFLQRMGLEALLDKYVPTTDRRNALSHAQALGVLLRSIVVEWEPVYRQQESEIAPVYLKNEGRIEALFTLYFLGLLVQALIEHPSFSRKGVLP